MGRHPEQLRKVAAATSIAAARSPVIGSAAAIVRVGLAWKDGLAMGLPIPLDEKLRAKLGLNSSNNRPMEEIIL